MTFEQYIRRWRIVEFLLVTISKRWPAWFSLTKNEWSASNKCLLDRHGCGQSMIVMKLEFIVISYSFDLNCECSFAKLILRQNMPGSFSKYSSSLIRTSCLLVSHWQSFADFFADPIFEHNTARKSRRMNAPGKIRYIDAAPLHRWAYIQTGPVLETAATVTESISKLKAFALLSAIIIQITIWFFLPAVFRLFCRYYQA